MIRNIYDMTLKLITPSEKGSQIDFTSKQDDILEAVCSFNEKFRTWSKRIIVYMISKKSIHLLLFMESEKKLEHISAREIRFFTTYLNNRKNWNEYSRNSSKLFESVNFSASSMQEALHQIEGMDSDSDSFMMQAEEIEFIRKESQKTGARSEAAETPDLEELSDEDVVVIVNYLVKTRNKGENRAQKAETLSEIKELLKKWL